MIGSRKPIISAIQLKLFYETTFDEDDSDFAYKSIDVKGVDMASNMAKMSAQCETHPKFVVTAKAKDALKTMVWEKVQKRGRAGNRNREKAEYY